jgi:hypothetical protein
MRDNSGFRVKPGTATLATRLKALGFATGAFVGGFPLTKRFGLTPGFDVYDDQMPEMKGAVSFAMPERRADVVVGRAVEWIGAQSQRFFSWVHVFDAHSPYRPPPEYASAYTSQPYYGEVAFIDQALGPLFDRLTTLPRPTLVIVTADHGENLMDRGRITGHGRFWNEGIHVPLVVRHPRGLGAGTRVQENAHLGDIVPTVLDVLGVEPPETIKGHVQSHFDGVSMRYSFDDAPATSARRTQFFSMLGSRGIWHDGWKAVTNHPTIAGWGNFNADEWELYHTDVDRSELHNLAAEEPEKLREMVNLWFAEAGANDAFPLDDRSALEILMAPRPLLSAPRDRYVYYPDVADVPESQSVSVRNRSFSIGALVDIPAPGADGVLFAHGARFGGHSLYLKDNRLHYVNNFVGMFEQKVVATEDVPTGENLLLSASFDKDGEDPPHVSTGILSLYYNEKKVGEGRIKTQPGGFELAGEGLCVGRDSGAAVTDDYSGDAPYRFTGGTINRVAVDVSGEPYLDLEREAQAMMSRE